MEIARQAGAADRKPGVVAPFRLREDARHVIQDVLDGVGDGRIPVGRGRHERDAARRVVDLRQRLLRAHHGKRAATALPLIAGGLRRRSAHLPDSAGADRAALRGGRTPAARFCSGAVTVTGGRLCRSVCASAPNGDTNTAAEASSVLRTSPAGDARRNME